MIKNLLKIINIKIFLISLFVGLIFMYFDNEKKKNICLSYTI